MGDQIYTPVMQVFTSDGDPGVGYKLYTYEAGTTTPKTVYTDEACTVAATNPVIFDSRGEATIYYADEYKFVLKTDADVTIWTVDSVGTAATSAASTYAYYPDPDESDHGVTASGTGDTIYDIVTALGVDEYGLIVLRHTGDANTTEYTLDTSIDLTLYPLLFIEVQPGAVFARTTGDETLTLPNPNHFVASKNQKITAVDMIVFDAPGEVYPEWWGAEGDGSTDDSAAIQMAIDSMIAVSGGVIQLAEKVYVANIEIGSYITLRGLSTSGISSHVAGVLRSNKATLKANATGYIIDTPATAINDCVVENISFLGLGAGTAVKGIYLDDCNRGTFRGLSFDNFSDQAIRLDEGVGNSFNRIIAINCLLDTSTAEKIGVIDIDSSTDNYLNKIEVTASLSAESSANLYLCGFKISGGNNFFTDCIGEISDVGFYVDSSWNSFTGCRADLNFGHGFQISASAGSNRFNSCMALRNSSGNDNLYDGFYLSGTSTSNIFAGCISTNIGADGWAQRYGFYDPLGSAGNKNIFTGCVATLNGTLGFYGNPYLGSAFPVHCVKQFTADDVTPSVEGGDVFWFPAYTGAADITDFDDGTPFQIIHIIDKQADGYITVKNNANIVTSTGADVNLTQNKVYSFIHDNGVWRYLS